MRISYRPFNDKDVRSTILLKTNNIQTVARHVSPLSLTALEYEVHVLKLTVTFWNNTRPPIYRGLITLSIVYWYGVFRAINIINYMTSKIIITKKALQNKTCLFRCLKSNKILRLKYETILYRCLKGDEMLPLIQRWTFSGVLKAIRIATLSYIERNSSVTNRNIIIPDNEYNYSK